MTASSQILPGALPPEQPPVQRPVPVDQALAAKASEAAAAAVIDATMAENGGATGEELAAAEQRAGILFDAASVEAAVSAAREQAHAEGQAELAQLREDLAETRHQLALMAGVRRQLAAVLRLCEGRRGDDLLLVSAVAVAAESGATALDGLPMRLTWLRRADIPATTDTVKRVTIPCESSYGGRAELVIEDDDRAGLADLLTAEVVADPATDPVPGDTAEDLPADDQADADARCARCGCTEDAACEGGCAWVPNAQMIDLCSACATPAELQAVSWKTSGGDR
ncbi:hypothetical protein ACFU0X_28495 [Streptomyces cellulosae]|uniref:Uncharacterized protein n=1 Tax=Streptomyces cellulosae TaxID=1968 RepID=A0ABW6JNG7_STRCE